MPPLLNTTLHALLVASSTVAGYCATRFACSGDPATAYWAVVECVVVVTLVRAVWPRMEVRCG